MRIRQQRPCQAQQLPLPGAEVGTRLGHGGVEAAHARNFCFQVRLFEHVPQRAVRGGAPRVEVAAQRACTPRNWSTLSALRPVNTGKSHRDPNHARVEVATQRACAPHLKFGESTREHWQTTQTEVAAQPPCAPRERSQINRGTLANHSSTATQNTTELRKQRTREQERILRHDGHKREPRHGYYTADCRS